MLAKHALIVDDSQTARAVLKHQLNQFDVIVESAPDGTHALEMLKDHKPDVIFLDHIMPGLDGFQVLQLLKDNQATRGIPVVMYTSQAATQYTREAKSLGAIGVIPKKVTNEQLVQVLDRAELYRFKAVDRHPVVEESANDGAGSDGKVNALNTTSDHSGPVARDGAGVVEKPAAEPSEGFTAVGADRRRRYYDPQHTASARNGFVTILLAALVLAQVYGFSRDRQQQKIILDLREQLELQELQLLHTKEEFAAEQSRLADATWQQVQFLADVLVDELEKE